MSDPTAAPTVQVPSAPTPDQPGEKKRKVPLIIRLYGVFCLVDGALTLPGMGLFFGLLAYAASVGDLNIVGSDITLSIILVALGAVITVVNSVGLIVFGHSLWRSHRRDAALWSRWLIVLTLVDAIINVMLVGMGSHLLRPIIQMAILVAISVSIDPTLIAERRSKRAEEDAQDLEAAKRGMLGRDLTRKGYLELNFFNLFWIFMVCCVIGLVLEIIWHMVVVEPGVYQDRAGLLFGPFSPIYGFGAVLITVALNRLWDNNPVVVFIAAGIVGGLFEAAVSWFMQTSFGVTAWDYSSYTIFGMPDPVAVIMQGRTSTMFLCMWGLLGLVWIKLLLPQLLKLINLIPWKLRYSVTTICAVLMLVNGIMTLQSLDCWFERVSGIEPTSAVEQYYAEHYDNDFMQHRFQSMTITPEDSTRLDASTEAPAA